MIKEDDVEDSEVRRGKATWLTMENTEMCGEVIGKKKASTGQ